MSRFEEFNPIQAIVLQEARLEHPKGLVVVVGGNSAGKTLLLRDIEKRLTTPANDLIVASAIELKVPADMAIYLKDLKDQGIAASVGKDRSSVVYANPGRREKAGGVFEDSQLINTSRDSSTNASLQHGVIASLSGMWASSLFLENRREMHQLVPRIGAAENVTNDLQALFRNQPAQDTLEAETEKVFGTAVWLDSVTNSTHFLLRTSQAIPDHKLRLDPNTTARVS